MGNTKNLGLLAKNIIVSGSSNYVGVGTTSPSNKLHIKGSSNYDGAIAVDNSTTTGGGTFIIKQNGTTSGFISVTGTALGSSGRDLAYYAESGLGHVFYTNGDTEKIRITSGGNIGIGTTSPTSISNYIIQTINGTSGSFTEWQENGSKTFRVGTDIGAGGFLFTQGAYGIRFGTNDSEKMRITSGGDVGIGITSPGYKLHVSGDIAMKYGSSLRAADYTYNKVIEPTWNGSYDIVNIYTAGDGSSNSTPKMTIRNDGNVGIGATIPLNKLDVAGNISLSSGGSNVFRILQSVAAAAYNGPGFYSQSDIGYGVASGGTHRWIGIDGNTEIMRIASNGNVLIGYTTANGNQNGIFLRAGIQSGFTSTNTAALELQRLGSTGNILEFYNQTSACGTITVTTSSTSYNTSSDYRLKKDFKSFNGLDLVSKIKVYDYKWKIDDTDAYGVIAHELQEIMPQAVTGEKDGEDMQQVDYSKLVPLLISSIQEQQALIKELQDEIVLLKNK